MGSCSDEGRQERRKMKAEARASGARLRRGAAKLALCRVGSNEATAVRAEGQQSCAVSGDGLSPASAVRRTLYKTRGCERTCTVTEGTSNNGSRPGQIVGERK